MKEHVLDEKPMLIELWRCYQLKYDPCDAALRMKCFTTIMSCSEFCYTLRVDLIERQLTLDALRVIAFCMCETINSFMIQNIRSLSHFCPVYFIVEHMSLCYCLLDVKWL